MSEIVELLLANARALGRQGRLPEAMAAYADVLRSCPEGGQSTVARVLFEMATLQRRAGLADAALDSYSRAIAAGLPNPEEAHLHRGLIYTDLLRDHAAAARELQAALSLNERYVPALHNLGNLYEDLGQPEDARAAYARILALDANWFEALGRFAILLPRSIPEHDMVRRLRSALVNPRAGAADRAGLGFALGQLLDTRERYAEAFEAYREANAASRASAPSQIGAYDRQRQEILTSSFIRVPFVRRVRDLRDAEDRRPQPVFICGMFRSGSTLVEQLLASHPKVGGGGELAFFPRLAANEFAPFPVSLPLIPEVRLESARESYLSMLASLFPGKAWVIDKRPDNFLYLGLIKTLFPTAKIIHTVRAPLDNCLSIYFLHLDQSMTYALDLMDIGHYYRHYRRLMAHWQAQFGDDIIDVDYDQFVHAPAVSGARLFKSLGLQWEDQYLARPAGRVVRTASVWQVREPIYTRASGRASHYSSHLTELSAYLADLMPATTGAGEPRPAGC